MRSLESIHRANENATLEHLRSKLREHAKATAELTGLGEILLALVDRLSETGYHKLTPCDHCGDPIPPGSGVEINGHARHTACFCK